MSNRTAVFPLALLFILWHVGCSTPIDDGGGSRAGDGPVSPGIASGGDPAADPTPGVTEETPPTADCAAAPYANRGPRVAGAMTLQTADGLPVEVWYPVEPGAEAGFAADVYDMRDWLPEAAKTAIPDDASTTFATGAWRDAPPAGFAAPVVIFSHGLGGFRTQSTFLTTHLATWGFVVAAPEHPERGMATMLGGGIPADNTVPQLTAALATLEAANAADGALAGRLDLTTVAVSGHSMGGAGAIAMAADPTISAWFTLGSVGLGQGPTTPGLVMGGATDDLAGPAQLVELFEGLAADPAHYVSVANAGHLAFTDICAIGRDQGGVLQIAIDHGLEIPDFVLQLANDGCEAGDLPAEEGWPVINHYVTAHLLANMLGNPPAGLTDASKACFDGLVADLRTRANTTPPDTSDPDPGTTDPGADDPADDPAVDPGTVMCNDQVCSLDENVCCVGLLGQTCTASCGAFEAPQACDGPEDCADGQACCVGFPQGAGCAASCGGQEQALCHDDSDCTGGATCMACSFPGAPPTNVCKVGGC